MSVFIDMIIRNGKKREGRKFRGVVFTKSRSILFFGAPCLFQSIPDTNTDHFKVRYAYGLF